MLLTPSVGSRASRLSPARHPHSCSISGSCWTRASSTSLSLWSCADPSFSRAANSFWRNGWRRTRYVEEVAGDMVISTHTHKSLFFCTLVCVCLCDRLREQGVLFPCVFLTPQTERMPSYFCDKEGACVKTDFVDCENDRVCVNACVCYLRCLLWMWCHVFVMWGEGVFGFFPSKAQRKVLGFISVCFVKSALNIAEIKRSFS